MEDGAEAEVVWLDLFLALSNLLLFAVLFPLRRPDGWLIAGATAVVCGVLFLAADRSRRGLLVLVASGVLCGGLLVVRMNTGSPAVDSIPWVMLGLGTAVGLNRVVFGVLGPVPSYRLNTQQRS